MADELEQGSVEAFAQKIREATGEVDPQQEPEEPEEVEEPEEAEEPEESEESEEPEEVTTAAEAADEAEAQLPLDASEAEIDAARQEAADEFYAGRYRTKDDVERALQEQVSLIGRQGQELGQLRAQIAEGQQLLAEEPQAQQLDRSAWANWAEEQVEAGAGSEGALAALREGGYEGYEIYAQAWLSNPETVGEATLFNNAMVIQMASHTVEAAQPQEQNGAEPYDPASENQAARQIVSSKRADFDEMQPYMQRVLQEMDPDERQWLSLLSESGVEGKVRALDQLYLEAAARGSRTEAALEARRQESAAGDRAKLAASDTPSESGHTRTPRSEAEQKAIAYGNERRKHWGTPLIEE